VLYGFLAGVIGGLLLPLPLVVNLGEAGGLLESGLSGCQFHCQLSWVGRGFSWNKVLLGLIGQGSSPLRLLTSMPECSVSSCRRSDQSLSCAFWLDYSSGNARVPLIYFFGLVLVVH
jgi:hypothetical protein